MANPTRSQEDYDAMVMGKLRDLGARSDSTRSLDFTRLDRPVEIDDEILKKYIDEIFRRDLRTYAYHIYRRAHNSSTAKKAYYQFINAYELSNGGREGYGNICCLTLDLAEDLLRKENTVRSKRKKTFTRNKA